MNKRILWCSFLPFPKFLGSRRTDPWWRQFVTYVAISALEPPARKCRRSFEQPRLFHSQAKAKRTAGGETRQEPPAMIRHYSLFDPDVALPPPLLGRADSATHRLRIAPCARADVTSGLSSAHFGLDLGLSDPKRIMSHSRA